jgi:hypothetical protein
MTPRQAMGVEGARLRFGQVELAFYLTRGFVQMMAVRRAP